MVRGCCAGGVPDRLAGSCWRGAEPRGLPALRLLVQGLPQAIRPTKEGSQILKGVCHASTVFPAFFAVPSKTCSSTVYCTLPKLQTFDVVNFGADGERWPIRILAA